jgi:hypothetical protein
VAANSGGVDEVNMIEIVPRPTAFVAAMIVLVVMLMTTGFAVAQVTQPIEQTADDDLFLYYYKNPQPELPCWIFGKIRQESQLERIRRERESLGRISSGSWLFCRRFPRTPGMDRAVASA